MSLRDNLNKIADTNMNRFPVQGGLRSYKLIETLYKYRLDRYSPPSRVFSSLFQGGSLTLYSSLQIIFILHLLII